MRFLLPVLPLLAATLSVAAQTGPRVVTPTSTPTARSTQRVVTYPWHKSITATVFWIGEAPSGRNTASNHHSSWDRNWQKNYGGFDDPNPAARANYRPKAFRPGLNPFYIALPYNDCVSHRAHRPEAARVIPWFRRLNPKPGDTVLRGRWLQIVHKNKYCFAQWEDCGPFVTDDWQYVFGNRPPRNKENGAAGIDVSPAVRDYLGIKSGDKVHWRFVELATVRRGPWTTIGANNPFVNQKVNPDLEAARRYNDYLRKLRDEAYQRKDLGN